MGNEVDKPNTLKISEILKATPSALAEDMKFLREVWVQLFWTGASITFPLLAVYCLYNYCQRKDWLHVNQPPISAYLFGRSLFLRYWFNCVLTT